MVVRLERGRSKVMEPSKSESDGAGKSTGQAAWGFVKGATLRNGVRAMLGSTADGTEFLRATAGSFSKGLGSSGTKKKETFEEACQRLDVDVDKFNVIHNQLVVQCYVTFFLGVAVLAAGVNLFLTGSSLATLLMSCSGALTCFATAALSSVRSFRIRAKSFDLDHQWRQSVGEWMPSRVPVSKIDRSGDGRVANEMIRSAAQTSKIYFFVSFFLLALAVLGSLTGASADLDIRYGLLFIAMIYCTLWVKNSILALQGRQKAEVDLISWLSEPSAWYPSTD